jgi:hypothetical protein
MWIGRQCQLVRLSRGCIIAEDFVAHAEARKNAEMPRFQDQDLLNVIDGGFYSPHRIKHGRAFVPTFGKSRFVLYQLVEMIERDVEAPRLHRQDPQPDQFVGNIVAGFDPDRSYIRRNLGSFGFDVGGIQAFEKTLETRVLSVVLSWSDYGSEGEAENEKNQSHV